MRKKTVTFGDIAQYTGFSKNTVSRYFNAPDTLTAKNREIIANALTELDYKENKVARILANGNTEFIGVVVPNLSMHFYSELLDIFMRLYDEYGYKFIVFTGNEQPDIERSYISELLAYKIEGMIILSHTIPSKELASYNVPIVSIEREDKYICSVNTDNFSGGQSAAKLLAESGSEILIHINSTVPPETPAYGRISGFCSYCEENGFEKEIIRVDWSNSFTENKQKLENILIELEQKYAYKRKGIFISNDTNAACLLNIIFKKHGRLPDDYRIVGFDNSSASAEAIIPISTIGQQLDLIAKEAMDLLVTQINEQKKRTPVPTTKPIHKIVPISVIGRETTNV